MSEMRILDAARRAVPAVDYALAAAGVAAAGALVVGFLGNGKAAVVIFGGMIIAMVLIFAFARLVSSQSPAITLAGIVLLWMIICFVGAFLIFTVTAFASGRPEYWARFLGLIQDTGAGSFRPLWGWKHGQRICANLFSCAYAREESDEPDSDPTLDRYHYANYPKYYRNNSIVIETNSKYRETYLSGKLVPLQSTEENYFNFPAIFLLLPNTEGTSHVSVDRVTLEVVAFSPDIEAILVGGNQPWGSGFLYNHGWGDAIDVRGTGKFFEPKYCPNTAALEKGDDLNHRDDLYDKWIDFYGAETAPTTPPLFKKEVNFGRIKAGGSYLYDFSDRRLHKRSTYCMVLQVKYTLGNGQTRQVSFIGKIVKPIGAGGYEVAGNFEVRLPAETGKGEVVVPNLHRILKPGESEKINVAIRPDSGGVYELIGRLYAGGRLASEQKIYLTYFGPNPGGL